jgi:hypothetical protein
MTCAGSNPRDTLGSAVPHRDSRMTSRADSISPGPHLRLCILLLLAIATVGPLLGGCAGGRVSSPGATYESPRTALRELTASTATGTITATARIEVSYRGERYPLKAAMMMRRPANLRLESIPLLGPPDFFLSIEAGELRVFLPEKGAFYAGPATRWNISRFLHLPLQAEEIVGFLMGRLPADWEDANDWYGEQEEEFYRVDRYVGGRKTCSLWIDPAAGRLARVRAFAGGGEIAYTADFTDHARVGPGFLPHRLTITSESVSLSVRYTEMSLIDDDGASFTLPTPEGMMPIPLEAK